MHSAEPSTSYGAAIEPTELVGRAPPDRQAVVACWNARRDQGEASWSTCWATSTSGVGRRGSSATRSTSGSSARATRRSRGDRAARQASEHPYIALSPPRLLLLPSVRLVASDGTALRQRGRVSPQAEDRVWLMGDNGASVATAQSEACQHSLRSWFDDLLAATPDYTAERRGEELRPRLGSGRRRRARRSWQFQQLHFAAPRLTPAFPGPLNAAPITGRHQLMPGR
jgi:hypothetical protein